jgi:hypothetical protein
LKDAKLQKGFLDGADGSEVLMGLIADYGRRS